MLYPIARRSFLPRHDCRTPCTSWTSCPLCTLRSTVLSRNCQLPWSRWKISCRAYPALSPCKADFARCPARRHTTPTAESISRQKPETFQGARSLSKLIGVITVIIIKIMILTNDDNGPNFVREELRCKIIHLKIPSGRFPNYPELICFPGQSSSTTYLDGSQGTPLSLRYDQPNFLG